jgi:RimJ/RimL family protein N-acetyltransferase
MKLRKLELKDAQGMLSWMKDPEVNCFFQFSTDNITIESVNKYINDAQDTSCNMHLAITNDEDEYLGTISLKSIDNEAKNAEYAISLCKKAHGTGVAFKSTKEILRIAFEDLNLHRVYLNVIEENERANNFYKKCGFVFEGKFREHLDIRGDLKNLNWYSLLKEEFEK